MHINETQNDNEVSLRRNGLRVIPLMADAGILGSELLAVHCVVAEEEDIRLMAEYGVSVSHNPASNMYLGSGIAPVLEMRRAGITVSLATDGAASNNAQDMIEALKLSVFGQRARQGSPESFGAGDAIEMATAMGARALGREDRLGAIAPGKLADLVVIHTGTAKMQPVHDPVAAIVFSCGEENVRTVVVNGRIILEEGHFTNLDESSILKRAVLAAGRLAEHLTV